MSKLEELQAEQMRIVMEGIKRAVEAEREACAKIADQYVGCDELASRIRSRKFE